MKKTLIYLFVLAFFAGCEDPIQIEVEEGKSQFIVDAFLNDLPENQKIRLAMSTPYFQSGSNTPVTGAAVSLAEFTLDQNGDTSLSNFYVFEDDNNNGTYRWNYTPGDTLIKANRGYALQVKYDDEVFYSFQIANPVPKIDSVVFVNANESEFGQLNNSDTVKYIGELYAQDFRGRRDYYQIRAYQNGEANFTSDENDLSVDGEFNENENDGITFIVPVRQLITDFGKLFVEGDSLYAELRSIAPETYYFMTLVSLELSKSDQGIFAVPATNMPSNIVNADKNSDKIPLGWFSVSKINTVNMVVKP